MDNDHCSNRLKEKESKEKANKMNMLQELDDFKLSLRKRKLFESTMKRRKSETNSMPSLNHNISLTISLSETEAFISNDLLQVPFSYETILQMLAITNDLNLIKYALAKLQAHCCIDQYILPKEVLIALAQCLLGEFKPIEQQSVIHYNVLFLLINATALKANDATVLYEKVFLVRLKAIISDQSAPFDIRYDVIWLIDNMISTQGHFNEVNDAIHIVELIEVAYSNQLDESYLIILLHCIDNIIQLSSKDSIFFSNIINDLIPTFIVKWKYYLSENQSKDPAITSKVLKSILIVLSNACNKTKKYIQLVNCNSQVRLFIDSLLHVLSHYTLASEEANDRGQVIGPSMTVRKRKVKEMFENKTSTLIPILIIIGDMLYSDTDDTFACFINGNLLNLIQHILDQLVLYCSHRYLDKIDAVYYYIAWLSNNFACQSIDYAKMLFFNTSSVPSLIKLNEITQLSAKSKRELISLFYNAFLKKDTSLNYFLLSPKAKAGDDFLLQEYLLTVLFSTKDNSLICLVIDFFMLIIEYYDSANKRKEKSDFLKLIEAKEAHCLLSDLQLSDNIEVSELSTRFLCEFQENAFDEIVDIPLDLSEEEEEDFDY